MSKNISKNIIKEIKTRNIKPKARWQFLLKKSVLWFSFGLCVLIGGLTMSVIIFMLISNDWDLYRPLNKGFVRFLFKTLPYVWIVIFVAFMSISYYNFKHTSKGYKYKLSVFILSSLLVSLVLGFAFFGIGVAKKIENSALQEIPQYKELTFDQRMKLWEENDKGVLAGKIESFEEDLEIKLTDLKGNKWAVILPKNAPNLQIGDAIALFGERIDKRNFKANKLRRWKGNFHERK